MGHTVKAYLAMCFFPSGCIGRLSGFLPAIDTTLDFEINGVKKKVRVTLTDGGVYDNLGLMALWPGRDKSINLDAGPVGRIIACRAGYSLDVSEPSATIIPRMKATFESVFARADNAATKRLFDLQKAGENPEFILPYLGQKDRSLKIPAPIWYRTKALPDRLTYHVKPSTQRR